MEENVNLRYNKESLVTPYYITNYTPPPSTKPRLEQFSIFFYMYTTIKASPSKHDLGNSFEKKNLD
jgi:hypothetical protein